MAVNLVNWCYENGNRFGISVKSLRSREENSGNVNPPALERTQRDSRFLRGWPASANHARPRMNRSNASKTTEPMTATMKLDGLKRKFHFSSVSTL